MLRWILGDDVFLKGAQQYLNDPKVSYGFASTDDLKRNLEKVSGKDLTYFFKQWYTGQGYPTYNVEWTQIGSSYVKIKMNQTTSHPSVTFYELPVALTFKNATNEKTVIVDNKSNGEIFLKNIGFKADTVIIDPNYWLITKSNTAKRVIDSSVGQNIVQVFPNPVQEQLSVYINNFFSSNSAVFLYNAAGQLLFKKSLSINGSEFLEIPFSHFPIGVYFIKVGTAKDIKFVKKIVKVKP
jgi:hypothetical protein